MATTYVDSILNAGTAYSIHSPSINLDYGAQQGYMPRIGMVGSDGKSYGEWISNHAYIRRNVIPVMLQSPRFFDFMYDSDQFVSTLKALMEVHPLTIEGLQSGLTVETDEHPIGAAGEQQEEVTNVTRARSQITYTFKERAGRSINKFLNIYIRYGMMDPDTKIPNVAKYISDIEDVGNMYTPDFYTCTMLYIEPDILHKVVTNAWLCTNMFPKSDGEVIGKRDIRSAAETPEYSIEFASITMNNEGVLKLADSILRELTVLNNIPDLDLVLPVTEIDPTVGVYNTGFDREDNN